MTATTTATRTVYAARYDGKPAGDVEVHDYPDGSHWLWERQDGTAMAGMTTTHLDAVDAAMRAVREHYESLQ